MKEVKYLQRKYVTLERFIDTLSFSKSTYEPFIYEMLETQNTVIIAKLLDLHCFASEYMQFIASSPVFFIDK